MDSVTSGYTHLTHHTTSQRNEFERVMVARAEYYWSRPKRAARMAVIYDRMDAAAGLGREYHLSRRELNTVRYAG